MHRTIHQDIPLVQCPFRGQKIGIPTLQDCLRACPELRLLFMITKEELYGKQKCE
jgi:hypothetical protein